MGKGFVNGEVKRPELGWLQRTSRKRRERNVLGGLRGAAAAPPWDFLQSGEWCTLVPSDVLTTSAMLISGHWK